MGKMKSFMPDGGQKREEPSWFFGLFLGPRWAHFGRLRNWSHEIFAEFIQRFGETTPKIPRKLERELDLFFLLKFPTCGRPLCFSAPRRGKYHPPPVWVLLAKGNGKTEGRLVQAGCGNTYRIRLKLDFFFIRPPPPPHAFPRFLHVRKKSNAFGRR